MSLEITLPATSLELFHEGEFGGRIFRTEEISDRRSYLIKCDRYEQSVNEYVAQCFIRAIGLPAPDARLIRISSEILQVNNIDAPVNVFGGVEYLGGIKRVFDRDIFESGDDRASAIVDAGVNSEEDRPMNEMEQATETLVFEQQDDQAQTTAIPASSVGEDWDIDLLDDAHGSEDCGVTINTE